MPREIVKAVAGRPYSLATRAGGLVFVAGQIGLDHDDKPVPGGIGPEMHQTMQHVKDVLAEAGATLDDVLMVNVYMTDLEGDYARMNEVYREHFGDEALPARATVGISELAFGLCVEVSCVAALAEG